VDNLQRLVLRRLDELGAFGEPMSAREAARRSQGKVSNDTLSKIAAGKHTGRITNRIAEGIAAALDVPASDVYDAAGAPRALGPWVLPEEFERITLERRTLIEDLCAALLAADAEGYDRGRRDNQ
jgi:hypothetical protein